VPAIGNYYDVVVFMVSLFTKQKNWTFSHGCSQQQRQHPEGAVAELVEAGTIECSSMEITQ
jgi:hypothetical protein